MLGKTINGSKAQHEDAKNRMNCGEHGKLGRKYDYSSSYPGKFGKDLWDYNADQCPHGKPIIYNNVDSKINVAQMIDVVKCDECYKHPHMTVGDLHLIFAVDDYECEHIIFAARE